MSDKNLICFFSWGRKELTGVCFENLLQNIRPQDRLLVFDNEGLNSDFYEGYRNRIDFFFSTKLNYGIGPVWMFLKGFLVWLTQMKENTFVGCEEVKWYPDYINIVESDAFGKEGWIGRTLEAFKISNVGIVSGFDSENWPRTGSKGNILFKDVVSGVNVILRTDYFMECSTIFQKTGQDRHISVVNKNKGKLIAIVPGEIIHLGDSQSTKERKIL